MSSTTQPPATSTSRTPSKTQSLYPTPTSTMTSSPSFLQSWSIERSNPLLVRSNSDHFPCSVRNVKSAQNQFPLVTQAKRMVDRTGELVEERIAEERESSGAQIRTLLNEQRKTIIAEYCE